METWGGEVACRPCALRDYVLVVTFAVQSAAADVELLFENSAS